jgi:RND family efflux transporter MFP subunit
MRNSPFAVIFILALLSGTGCSKEKDRVLSGEPSAIPVSAVVAKKQEFVDSLTSFGFLSFKTKNDVTSLVEGTLVTLLVKEGDTVNQGQTLARLRNIQLELQREQAENSVIQAESAYNLAQTKRWETRLGIDSRFIAINKTAIMIEQKTRELEAAKEELQKNKTLLDMDGITETEYKSMELSYRAGLSDLDLLKYEMESASLGLTTDALAANGITPAQDPALLKEQLIALNIRGVQAEIEVAESSLRNAKNSLASVNSALNELTLVSPMSGVVGASYYERGEFVKQNEKVFTIIDIANVYAVFSIQEQDIHGFSIGSPLKIEVQSLAKTMDAAIDEISPIADSQSGNFSVKALIANTDETMKPGMFVKCDIPKTRLDTLIPLPETVLVSEKQESGIIFCVVNGRAVQKEVKIYAHKDGRVWVSSGINENETVVDKPNMALREGASVAVM